MIHIVTWGRNHGPGPVGDIEIDAALFVEPVPELRCLDGRHPLIQDVVFGVDPVAVSLVELAGTAAARMRKLEGSCVVSISCRHGKHRSVAAGELLALRLRALSEEFVLVHRDLGGES